MLEDEHQQSVNNWYNGPKWTENHLARSQQGDRQGEQRRLSWALLSLLRALDFLNCVLQQLEL